MCFLIQWKGIYRDTSDDETLICCSTLAGNSSAAAEELELSWGWLCRRSVQDSEMLCQTLVAPAEKKQKFNEEAY